MVWNRKTWHTSSTNSRTAGPTSEWAQLSRVAWARENVSVLKVINRRCPATLGLMWLAISTRPDISNTVRSVARYCSAPKAVHWKSALGILAFINGTCGFGITYQRGTTVRISLEAFADVDYASRATDSRSASGDAVMCAGACVCWFSRTQKCVTLSTSEAEYVALDDAVKEFLFLRQVWRFMIPGKEKPCFPVFEDNQGAL